MKNTKKLPRNIGWISLPPALGGGTLLSDSEKLILGKIIGLIGDEGYCWSGNDFFAQALGWTEKKVNRICTSLVSKEYLTKQLIKPSDFKTERRLFIVKGISSCLSLPKNGESESPKMGSRSIDNTNINKKAKTRESSSVLVNQPQTSPVTPLPLEPLYREGFTDYLTMPKETLH